MFERIANGWHLARQSFRVLMLDKELLVFPLLSGIAAMLVLASFGIPLFYSGAFDNIDEAGRQQLENPLAYVVLFAYYFCNYFVIVFFNTALIACAMIRFKGGDPTLGDGLRAAAERLPQIAAWAAVSATVGLILRAIESRSERLGRIVSSLIGAAWTILTYFVVPVLVVERVGPIEAIKRSAGVLKRTWGEALISNVGVGLFVFLLVLASLVPAGAGVAIAATTGSPVAVIAGAIITVLLIVLVSLVSSAVSAVLQGALYLYATEGQVPQQFDEARLQHAFRTK